MSKKPRIFAMSFASVYPLYVQKAVIDTTCPPSPSLAPLGKAGARVPSWHGFPFCLVLSLLQRGVGSPHPKHVCAQAQRQTRAFTPYKTAAKTRKSL